MTWQLACGIAIIAAVLAVIVGLTVAAHGRREALVGWIFSLTLTAILALGAWLISMGLPS